MLTAFLDDSGTDGSGHFCVVAGYVAEAEQWKAFSDAWDKELRSEPKITHLKMSEAHSRRGPFWGWDNEARDQKIVRFAKIVNEYAVGGVASIVSHKAYRAEAKGFLPDTIDHPYWLCFQQVVLEAIRLYGNEFIGGKVNFVFDTQGEGLERRAGLIHSSWQKVLAPPYNELVGTIAFASDRDALPIQAADLLAWHIRRRGDRAMESLPEDRPTDSLLGEIPIAVFSWNADEISEWVEGYQLLHPHSPLNKSDDAL